MFDFIYLALSAILAATLYRLLSNETKTYFIENKLINIFLHVVVLFILVLIIYSVLVI